MPASSRMVARLDRRIERGHEQRQRRRVEDDVGDLVRLLRHQPPPDRVALRPDLLALVVEALRVLVHHDAEHHAVEPRDDAAVVFRRARVDRDRVALGRIAGLLHAAIEQQLQHRAAIVRRAADEEVVGGRPPVLLQPFDVGFEAAAGRHERRGAHHVALSPALHGRGQEHAVVDVEIDHLGVVCDLDAEVLGGEIERVEHRAPAAEEERVGAAEAQACRRARAGSARPAAAASRARSWIRRSCGAPAPRRCAPCVTCSRSLKNSSSG